MKRLSGRQLHSEGGTLQRTCRTASDIVASLAVSSELRLQISPDNQGKGRSVTCQWWHKGGVAVEL
jgi:hypothetical protein